MKAGGVALRLVLLALLLLGVGVLHPLSHAGVHGGLSATSAVPDHPAHATLAEAAGGPHASVAGAEHGDPQHRAHAEGTPAADCLALIPSGSWLLPPSCISTWTSTAEFGAVRAGLAQDPGGGPAHSQLPVLRI